MVMWVGVAVGCQQTVPESQVESQVVQEIDWSASVVTVEFSRKSFVIFRPWSVQLINQRRMGLVVGPSLVLTTAADLELVTLVRVQRNGRGPLAEAEVIWTDPHLNMALLRVKDEAFMQGTAPVRWSQKIPDSGRVKLHFWEQGNMRSWDADITRLVVRATALSFVQHKMIELTSTAEGGSPGEPVSRDGEAIGMIAARSGERLRVIPADLIQPVLEAVLAGDYRGVGYFPFFWQPGENPELLRHLGLKDVTKGVVVTRILESVEEASVLAPEDVILEIDGFVIESNGDYRDPVYGFLNLEGLATRDHWAGDTVTMKVWRKGELKEVELRLPRADYGVDMVPSRHFDQRPEFLIAGGLVFQPLSGEFLRGFGPNWQRNAPFRLYYYSLGPPTEDRSSLVVMTQVLPHPFNTGYENVRFQVVDRINGKKVETLRDVREALQSPKDGIHLIEFLHSREVSRMVLDAALMDRATREVMQLYQIQESSYISGEDAQRMESQHPVPMARRISSP